MALNSKKVRKILTDKAHHLSEEVEKQLMGGNSNSSILLLHTARSGAIVELKSLLKAIEENPDCTKQHITDVIEMRIKNLDR